MGQPDGGRQIGSSQPHVTVQVLRTGGRRLVLPAPVVNGVSGRLPVRRQGAPAGGVAPALQAAGDGPAVTHSTAPIRPGTEPPDVSVRRKCAATRTCHMPRMALVTLTSQICHQWWHSSLFSTRPPDGPSSALPVVLSARLLPRLLHGRRHRRRSQPDLTGRPRLCRLITVRALPDRFDLRTFAA